MVGFGVESRWLVAGCEFGCGDGTALGVDLAHGVFGQVAAVGGLVRVRWGEYLALRRLPSGGPLRPSRPAERGDR